MNIYLQLTNDNLLFNISIISLILSSLVVSFSLLSNFKWKKHLAYGTWSSDIQEMDIEKINHKSGHSLKIENLNITDIVFWNRGTKKIYQEKSNHPYLLKLDWPEDVVIFDFQIIFESEKENNLRINIKNNSAQLSFENLANDQGGIIKLLHSGEIAETKKLCFTTKEELLLKKVDIQTTEYYLGLISLLPLIGRFYFPQVDKSFFIKIYPWLTIILGIATFVILPQIEISFLKKLLSILIGIGYLLFGASLVLVKKSVPKELEKKLI